MNEEEKLFEEYMKRPIAYRVEFAKAIGSVKLAVLLSQLHYWSDKGHDPEGWIYKTREQIFEETGLSRQEQETARKWGRTAGVLEEIKKGIPRRVYFRINKEVIINLILKYRAGDRPPSRRKSPLQVGRNKAGQWTKNRPAISETITKNKSKSNSKSTASAPRHIFTKRFFQQAKEWLYGQCTKPGPELQEVMNWTTKHYGSQNAHSELYRFIEYWTEETDGGQLWEMEDFFAVYDRLKGWLRNSERFGKLERFSAKVQRANGSLYL